MEIQPLAAQHLALPLFDGYPYLATRIAPMIHHLILLPADRSDRELEVLARRQHAANRIRTCLVLGEGRALYLSDGESVWDVAPRCTDPVAGRLRPVEAFRLTPELHARAVRLGDFVQRPRGTGFFVDRPRGRRATAADRLRLRGTGAHGVPRGLGQCPVCRAWRGEALLVGQRAIVVDVFCRCENHNRCARCLGHLHECRLDGCRYDEESGEVVHMPAFLALKHVCADQRQA